MARRKKNSNLKMNIALIALMLFSIVLAILTYTKAGYIGKALSPILGGILGSVKNVLPIGLFLISLYVICKKEERFLLSKIIKYIIILLCIATIFSVYEYSKGNLNFEGDFWKVIKNAYTIGEMGVGGGAIGTIIALPLTNLIGNICTFILAFGIGLVALIYIFNFKLVEFFSNIIEKIKEGHEASKEYREQEFSKRAEKRKIEKQNKEKNKKFKEKEQVEDILEDQITINLNNKKPLKEQEIIEPKTQTKNNIEENLFKQEQEKKEEKVKEILTLEHALTVEDENYEFPPITLMQQGKSKELKGGKKALTDTASKLQKTLYSFGVSAKVENVSVGPAITRYELKPAEGVRVSKIANLADDIALNLAAESIRIEAPIPGKQAVGIEIPNPEKEVVHLRDIIESENFETAKSKLAFALGKDVAGEEVVTDIAKMPHVLIAGSTGSGKSVCINTLVTSIIYKAKPSEVKLVMIDPKVVELSVYNGIPHLLIPVVTDPKKAAGALAWAVQEMVNRYSLFAGKNVRDIKGYNEAIEKDGEKLPQIVIIIDELADLMMVAANDVEDAICRLAQMARAAGMHLVIATQRPSVDVITGIIKANIPSRISFAVSSQVDSRTILDMAGAEKLLGKGDMLFAPVGIQKPIRIQGAFVDDKEVEKIVEFLKSNGEVKYNEDILEKIETSNMSDKELDADEDDDSDPFLMDAIDTVVETGQASTSFIQRRFKVGYARAGRIMDQMEARGVISGYEGSKPRQVLLSKEQLQELKTPKEPVEQAEE